ncbi:MAG: ATP-binding cassette domain-containing protein [Kistimonas sp.]|nr:ATP-binding cassette domain-containing protein [Kistimonas sp.]
MSLLLQDIRLSLPGQVLLSSFSLTVAPGEIVSLMGPSGCGKSSLLAYICGIAHESLSTQGHIFIDGQQINGRPAHQRPIGLMFQDDLLFPHMSVAGNLAFALPRHLSGKERRQRVEDALNRAQLPGQGQARPDQLSGGERARVSLMRTLLAEPRALLLDEPFSRLDARLRQQVRQFVFDQARRKGIPTLLVTHDEQDCHGRVISLDTRRTNDA